MQFGRKGFIPRWFLPMLELAGYFLDRLDENVQKRSKWAIAEVHIENPADKIALQSFEEEVIVMPGSDCNQV